MMNVKLKNLLSLGYFILHLATGYANDYRVVLTSNSPAIIGSTVTFTAELYKNDERPSGKFYYYFHDDFSPENHFHNETSSTTVHWNVTYTGKDRVGNYTAKVVVKSSFIFGALTKEISSNRTAFSLTSQLNGNVELKQNGTLRQSFVSTAVAVDHYLSLTAPDFNYISKNSSSFLTFWFIDCVYYGLTIDFKPFSFNYTDPDNKHRIETLTIPFTFPPTPPTTTTTTTTTPPPTTTTTTTTTTTPAPTTSTTEKPTTAKPSHNIMKRSTISDRPSIAAPDSSQTTANINQAATYIAINSSADNNRTILEINTNEISDLAHSISEVRSADNKNSTASNSTTPTVPSAAKDTTPALPAIYSELNYYFPSVNVTNSCIKPSDLILGLNKPYAFTTQAFKTVAPVSNIEVNGAKWLQEQEVLNITVTCKGSAVYKYCVQIVGGLYNVTGNETCFSLKTLQTCHFGFTRFFLENNFPVHTLLIIIENEVSKIVKPVAINMYRAVKQTQLSVIVVPVVASAVAVILVVFGISYYIQSRKRYQIEVADFDFSHASDMEYKTFRERLREAILSAINRTQDFSDQDSSTSSWPPPQSRKYGSMPEPENPS